MSICKREHVFVSCLEQHHAIKYDDGQENTMIEVSDIRVPLARLGRSATSSDTVSGEKRAIREALLHRLRLSSDMLSSIELTRRSIDARKKNHIVVVYTLHVRLRAGSVAEQELLARLARQHQDHGVHIVEQSPSGWPLPLSEAQRRRGSRPVVVGAGCAGLFCALALAKAGLAPLLIERGDDTTRRTSTVRDFNQTGKLDTESNIQFGLGGAGTFSDGKLATGTRSPLHRLILQTFVEAGADPAILWDYQPHIGSDVLPRVVKCIATQICELGGELRCRTRLSGLHLKGGSLSRQVQAITLTQMTEAGSVREEHRALSDVVIACGHSARDVYELLQHTGVVLERKTFAMGVRVEHLQADVNRGLFGSAAGNPALGAAPYKLVAHLPKDTSGAPGRAAFTFCMCPGGYVVAAASEAGGVVTNGMSLAARDSAFANAGLLVNVTPEDLPGNDVLAGIYLQRHCEQRAYDLGGGDYVAPAQLVGDFIGGVPSTGPGSVLPTYPRGVAWGALDDCLPPHVTATLRTALPLLAHKARFFRAQDAVLTGVESRSSSPIRVKRDESYQAIGIRGLWPAGEGAGYAGGIMSAATDGIHVAESLLASRREGDSKDGACCHLFL